MGIGEVVVAGGGGALLVLEALEIAGEAAAISPAAPIARLRLQISRDSKTVPQIMKPLLAKLIITRILLS